ncbi:uncharacterized protein LOC110274883 [Arachis duranensis]|uniref:Uncharacterized protein LOC110274883 n=1 Tax=Arachis duranensis TaxID=130453 RepID=A0A6P5MN13_ARADU|nr:uncharacterized protein LOC110274883 [Arachis duranensis]
MLCLLETHLSGPKANKIAKRFGFSDWFLKECISFSGGIWILWNSNFWNVEVLMSHRQYVHMKLRYGLESPWYFTVVYGSPQIRLRTSLWEGLKSIADNLTSEWCVGGDFNCVLSATDTGGNSGLSRDHDCFADCLLECGLQDLGFKGQPFTWQKGIIRRRLDKYTNWKDEISLDRNVTNFMEAAKVWNKEVFSDIHRKKNRILARLNGISLKLGFEINYGDRNTSYFHNLATARRQRNRVTMLKNQHGEWVDDTFQLQQLGMNHFLSLYADDQPYEKLVASGLFPTLTSEEVGRLDRMVAVEEVFAAIFSMGAWKAPGPDGLPPMFYQSNWSLVKTSVENWVKKVFVDHAEIKKVNNTYISLIPKREVPENFSHF